MRTEDIAMRVAATKTTAVPHELQPQIVLATVAATLIGAAYLKLPDQLTVGPTWLLLVLEAVFVIPLLYSAFVQHLRHETIRVLRLGLQGALILAMVSSVGLLISHLHDIGSGGQLIQPAVILWLSNILMFSEWYWEMDGGGPVGRHHRGHKAQDFLFPQQQGGQSFAPGFVDYVFLAFCFATAFSPADTSPLTQRAKLLVMAEALLSMLIITLLIARSVNIL
jgi:hypothetical protein